MIERTNGTTDTELLATVERNGFALVAAFSAWDGADVHDGPDTLHVLTDVPDPAFNMVVRAELSDDNADEAIAAVQAAAAARGVPLVWLVGPASKPLGLGPALARHGFLPEEDALAMTLDLRTNEPEPTAPGLTVRAVADAGALATWARIVTAGFDLPDWTEESMRNMTGALMRAQPSTFHGFVVHDHGHAIGAASLFIADGVAGVYNVATLEHARGRGAATAATIATLRRARELGCDHAVLQASAAAAGVYRRLGFEYRGRIGVHTWTPDVAAGLERPPG